MYILNPIIVSVHADSSRFNSEVAVYDAKGKKHLRNHSDLCRHMFDQSISRLPLEKQT